MARVKKPDGGAKLKATQLETELVNMHRRVLTRGRRGSFRAQLTMTGETDASAWIRARLDRVVRRVLTSYMGKEIADDEQMQFRTTIERDGRVVVRGAARVVENRNIMQTPFFYYARRSPPGTAPFRFAASFRLVCEGGAVLFKEPDVYLPDRPSFEAPPPWLWAANPGYAFGLAHAPTSLVEFGQSLFLSSVTVDPTTSFAVTALEPSTVTTPGALQVSVEAGPSLAPSRLPTKAPSVTLSGASRPALFKKKKKRPEPAPTPTPAMMASTAAVIPQTRFVVGENLPWVLNAKNAAPFAVFSSMVFLSILFQLFALPDACFRIAAAVPTVVDRVGVCWRCRARPPWRSGTRSACSRSSVRRSCRRRERRRGGSSAARDRRVAPHDAGPPRPQARRSLRLYRRRDVRALIPGMAASQAQSRHNAPPVGPPPLAVVGDRALPSGCGPADPAPDTRGA